MHSRQEPGARDTGTAPTCLEVGAGVGRPVPTSDLQAEIEHLPASDLEVGAGRPIPTSDLQAEIGYLPASDLTSRQKSDTYLPPTWRSELGARTDLEVGGRNRVPTCLRPGGRSWAPVPTSRSEAKIEHLPASDLEVGAVRSEVGAVRSEPEREVGPESSPPPCP